MSINLRRATRRLALLGLVAATLGAAASATAAPQNRGVLVPGDIGAMTASGDRWAVVNSNATFARGKGVFSVSRGDTATGSYVVRFNRNVTNCMYQGTIGLSGIVGVESPGEITVVRRFNDPNAIYVTTHNSGGTQTDRGFHLYVGCN